jgi:hypothetical protein
MEHPPEAIPPSPLVCYIRDTYTCDDYFQLLPKALNKNPYTVHELYENMYNECLIQDPSTTSYTWTTFGILKVFTNNSKYIDQQELIYLSSRSGSYICKKNDKEIYLKNFFYELLDYQ